MNKTEENKMNKIITDMDLFNAGHQDGRWDASRGTKETIDECTGNGETLKSQLSHTKYGYVMGFASKCDPDDISTWSEDLQDLLTDARIWAAKRGIYS